jgi:hypothetical protein
MKDYTEDLNDKLRKKDSIGSKSRNYQTAYQADIEVEKTPYMNPTQISKGTISTTLGGIVDFKDEGGTTVFTYNPVSRVITITGNVSITGTANFGTSVTTGTISATFGTFSGGINSGTSNFGTINFSHGTAGTVYAGEYQMTGNVGNKIREFFGLGLVNADKVGANAVRIQNSDLTDMVQFNSKGGMTLVPQAAIGTPDEGQMYYDSGANKMRFYNGSGWEEITSGTV